MPPREGAFRGHARRLREITTRVAAEQGLVGVDVDSLVVSRLARELRALREAEAQTVAADYLPEVEGGDTSDE